MDRRDFLLGAGAALVASCAASSSVVRRARRFRFVHVDVFTAQPLAGNPLDVFLDARGLGDAEMLALTRETYLSEATFVLPRDAATERERGIRVRIFGSDGELPFAGHPTLGSAAVLRPPGAREVALELNVGKVPVRFTDDATGGTFGEMQQVAPSFGATHDRATIAGLHGLTAADLDDLPIQTVSTGLPFAIVPLRRLAALQALRIDADKMTAYVAKQEPNFGFYYVTRDTGDPGVALRARCVYPGGEDAATGSAAGCTAAWLVRYGVAAPDARVHIRQGVEMKRTSDLFVRAGRDGDRIANVRVGGNAVQTMAGEVTL
ncbi:MAG TPA: PhzF family phenazine biosynthesis protein [Kofleriaceae bacterium]|nr:PhzF family phenazine biosynthesis protein [Kofleriaceae bacterium]